MNDRMQQILDEFIEKTFRETGEMPTEIDLYNAYYAQYLKDRREGNLDDYDPGELESLEKTRQQRYKLLENSSEFQQKLEELKKSNDIKKEYRTAAKTGKTVEDYPDFITAITLDGYTNAISLYDKGNAYLTPLPTTDGLTFKDGKMYFANDTVYPISEAQLKDLKTKEDVNSIDLPLLRSFYSILLKEIQDNKKQVEIVTLYLPKLAGYLGISGNLNENAINSIIAKTQKFHNIVGVVKGRYGESIFPVLNFEGYDKDKNTISFSSPYMKYVIGKIIDEWSIRTDQKGKPKLKKNGEPLRVASHSYAIKSEIQNERNKNAVENVFIIVTLIEKCGDNVPNISAQTLIDRNEQLKIALESSKNPPQLLQRCFKKTWELLRTKTKLTEMYKDIELPDPKNPANIPTPKTLKTTIFYFRHNGKKK